ncbi:MAG: hypothetical protein IPJ28_20295 [Betaproteobacteria bacterium]|nr:hypothetical protein [Betaproteobacteria bacterium]
MRPVVQPAFPLARAPRGSGERRVQRGVQRARRIARQRGRPAPGAAGAGRPPRDPAHDLSRRGRPAGPAHRRQRRRRAGRPRRSGIDEDELRRRVEAAYRQPFDLEKGPVLRADLFWLADADHVLLVTAHHIAVDGLSQMQLLDELRSLYAEATGGPAAGLARAETDYADFTRWQSQMLEGPEGRRLVDYWRTQLAEPRARIELPADRRRQARRSTRAATLAVSLDAGLSDGLRQLARNESTTLYVVLLAAFKTLLFRYTGTQDVIVGTPTFGRDRP